MNEILLGSCIDLMKLQKPESAHLVFTSPPYYNARDYSLFENYDSYLDFMAESFELIFKILKESRFFIINTSPVITPRISRSEKSHRHAIPFDLHPRIIEAGFEFVEDIVWEKPAGSAFNRNGIFAVTRKPLTYHPNMILEYLMVYRKPGVLIDEIISSYDDEITSKSIVTGKYEQTNLWKINPVNNPIHPAVFPEGLVERAISYYTMMTDLVVDPFCGSGTTCVVARRLGRNYLGFEKDVNYYKLAKTRLAQSIL